MCLISNLVTVNVTIVCCSSWQPYLYDTGINHVKLRSFSSNLTKFGMSGDIIGANVTGHCGSIIKSLCRTSLMKNLCFQVFLSGVEMCFLQEVSEVCGAV